MKSKIIYGIAFLAIALIGLISCEDETTGGYTGVTIYPTLDLVGESQIIVAKGASFVDPGFSSILDGEDVSDQVVVSSDVNTDVPGVYTITYEIVNPDGYPVSKSRTIYVADTTPSPIATGMHNVLGDTHRINNNSNARTDFSGYDILILQTEPGIYYCSDLIGGYYDQKVGYGSNYAMTGYFQLNADNTITLISSSVSAWGDSADEMHDASFDPVTGRISWTVEYAGFLTFNIVLN